MIHDGDGSKGAPVLSSNTAYGVVSHSQGSGEEEVAMYEMVGQPSSSATRPTTQQGSGHIQPSPGPLPPLTHNSLDPAYDVIAEQ